MYRVDNGPPQPYGGPFAFDARGRAHDRVPLRRRRRQRRGLQAASRSRSTPRRPTTTASTSPGEPLGTDGWYDGAVTVTLTARDGAGSGVAGDACTASTAAPGRDVHRPVHRRRRRRARDRVSARPTSRATSSRRGRCASRSTRPRRSRPRASTAPRRSPRTPARARVAFTRTDGDGSGAVSTEYRVGDGGRGRRTPARSTSTALGGVPRRLPLARPRRQRRALPHGDASRSRAARRRPPSRAGAGAAPAPFAALEPVAPRRARPSRRCGAAGSRSA